jgi:hypothetical protein
MRKGRANNEQRVLCAQCYQYFILVGVYTALTEQALPKLL